MSKVLLCVTVPSEPFMVWETYWGRYFLRRRYEVWKTPKALYVKDFFVSFSKRGETARGRIQNLA